MPFKKISPLIIQDCVPMFFLVQSFRINLHRPITKRRCRDIMKQRCRGWTGFVFTGNLELAKYIGLKASRRIVLFNGPIECRLLKYDLY